MERDISAIEISLAKAIYEANRIDGMAIWENLSDNVRDWILRQSKAALEYLVNEGKLKMLSMEALPWR